MFLTEKHSSIFSQFFSKNPKKPPQNPFNQTLITQLNSLLPIPNSPSIPLSHLSRAIDLLTLTLADLTTLISDSSDQAALSSHLDSTLALLDACNAISATADQILHRCLFVRLALHLLASPSSDRIARARSAIAEWDAADFDLQARIDNPNRAVSDLVYNEIVGKFLGEICCGEIEGMKRRVKKLGILIDEEEGNGGVTEGLGDAVSGVEEALEELTEGMDGVGKAVNGLFRVCLESREKALQCFRSWNGMCD